MINNLKKKVLKNLLLKLFVLSITLVLLDFIIGSLLDIFYFRQESGVLYRTTYAIEKTKEDLLIFGSSTAIHNYDPTIFEKGLKMSAYNVGNDGRSVFYHYAVLQAVLKRYKPKIIIYDFEIREFSKDQESYDRISSLLPYYKKNPEIRPIIELKSPYEKYKLLSNIYPYNSLIFTIGIGNTEFNKKRRGDINGFVPLPNIWNHPIDTITFVNRELDSNKIKIFESFVKDCANAKIELFVVCSPILIEPDYTSNSEMMGEKIAKKYNVNFMNYSKDSLFINNPKLFADIGHLNVEGAKIFSNIVKENIARVSKSLTKTGNQ